MYSHHLLYLIYTLPGRDSKFSQSIAAVKWEIDKIAKELYSQSQAMVLSDQEHSCTIVTLLFIGPWP